MILMDTDVCVEILRGNTFVIEARLRCEDDVAISFITVGELYYGAERSKNKTKNIHIVDAFLLTVDILNTNLDIMKKFGEIKSHLYNNNLLIPDADILIASTALTRCSKLITGNTKHYHRFENLIIENWMKQ